MVHVSTIERCACVALLLPAATVVGLRLWNGGGAVHGLLASKTDGARVTPERLPLLVVTAALAIWYAVQVVLAMGSTVPGVPAWSLWVFAASCTVYALGKAVRTSR